MDNLLKKLTKAALQFRNERNWEKFHTGKDLAMCLNVESGELLELFLWKEEKEVDVEKLSDEIGDVFYTLLILSDKYSLEIDQAFLKKLNKNQIKYPIKKFKGSNKKYNED